VFAPRFRRSAFRGRGEMAAELLDHRAVGLASAGAAGGWPRRRAFGGALGGGKIA
jgi:hypothetical protein